MILFTIKMLALPAKRKELLQTLEAIVDRVRSETGCVNANLYQDLENDREFMLVEKWRDKQNLENYIRSDSFSVLLGADGLLDHSAEIKIYPLSRPSGMEAVLEMRRRAADSEIPENGPPC